MGILNYTTQKINEILGKADRVTNPNLLDNWYFGNPVNQRGETTYDTQAYTIDRWKIGLRSGGNITLASDGVVVNRGTGDLWFDQVIEYPEPYIGKTVTLSLLTSDGSLYYGSGEFTGIPASGYNTKTLYSGSVCSLQIQSSGSSKLVYVRLNMKQTVTIVAVKLELGNHQTLAHQEDGVWVLNEVPNYLDQLRKCQRFLLNLNPGKQSYVPVGSVHKEGNGNVFLTIPTPVPMRRGTFTIAFTGNFTMQIMSPYDDQINQMEATNPAFTMFRVTDTFVKLSTSAFGTGAPPWMLGTAKTGGTVSSFLISAEL